MAPSMMKRSVLAAVTVGLAAADPVLQIQQDWADPSFIQSGDTWYSYATAAGGKHVQVATAGSFDGPWQVQGNDLLPDNPPAPWVVPDNPTGSFVYAPDVIQRPDGQYVLYFAANVANPQGGLPNNNNNNRGYHCVGAAVGSSLLGPFTAQDSAFACPIAQGGAIDPAGFTDSDGTLYVVYKVDGNNIGDQTGSCGQTANNMVPTPIMLQKMMSDGVTPDGDPVEILDRSDADGPLVEAPYLNLVDGVYYLFFSSNCYSSGEYDTSYATASSVAGPYTKAQAPDAPLLQKGTYGLTDPGGASTDGAGSLIMFHADADQPGGVRYMYTAHITEGGNTVHISS